MKYFIAVTVLAIGTYIIRSFFLFLGGRINLSNKVKTLLSFLTVTILPTLIAPSILYHNGQVSMIAGKERLLACLIAVFISIKTKSILFTMIGGFCALILLVHLY